MDVEEEGSEAVEEWTILKGIGLDHFAEMEAAMDGMIERRIEGD